MSLGFRMIPLILSSLPAWHFVCGQSMPYQGFNASLTQIDTTYLSNMSISISAYTTQHKQITTIDANTNNDKNDETYFGFLDELTLLIACISIGLVLIGLGITYFIYTNSKRSQRKKQKSRFSKSVDVIVASRSPTKTRSRTKGSKTKSNNDNNKNKNKSKSKSNVVSRIFKIKSNDTMSRLDTRRTRTNTNDSPWSGPITSAKQSMSGPVDKHIHSRNTNTNTNLNIGLGYSADAGYISESQRSISSNFKLDRDHDHNQSNTSIIKKQALPLENGGKVNGFGSGSISHVCDDAVSVEDAKAIVELDIGLETTGYDNVISQQHKMLDYFNNNSNKSNKSNNSTNMHKNDDENKIEKHLGLGLKTIKSNNNNNNNNKNKSQIGGEYNHSNTNSLNKPITTPLHLHMAQIPSVSAISAPSISYDGQSSIRSAMRMMSNDSRGTGDNYNYNYNDGDEQVEYTDYSTSEYVGNNNNNNTNNTNNTNDKMRIANSNDHNYELNQIHENIAVQPIGIDEMNSNNDINIPKGNPTIESHESHESHSEGPHSRRNHMNHNHDHHGNAASMSIDSVVGDGDNYNDHDNDNYNNDYNNDYNHDDVNGGGDHNNFDDDNDEHDTNKIPKKKHTTTQRTKNTNCVHVNSSTKNTRLRLKKTTPRSNDNKFWKANDTNKQMSTNGQIWRDPNDNVKVNLDKFKIQRKRQQSQIEGRNNGNNNNNGNNGNNGNDLNAGVNINDNGSKDAAIAAADPRVSIDPLPDNNGVVYSPKI